MTYITPTIIYNTDKSVTVTVEVSKYIYSTPDLQSTYPNTNIQFLLPDTIPVGSRFSKQEVYYKFKNPKDIYTLKIKLNDLEYSSKIDSQKNPSPVSIINGIYGRSLDVNVFEIKFFDIFEKGLLELENVKLILTFPGYVFINETRGLWTNDTLSLKSCLNKTVSDGRSLNGGITSSGRYVNTDSPDVILKFKDSCFFNTQFNASSFCLNDDECIGILAVKSKDYENINENDAYMPVKSTISVSDMVIPSNANSTFLQNIKDSKFLKKEYNFTPPSVCSMPQVKDGYDLSQINNKDLLMSNFNINNKIKCAPGYSGIATATKCLDNGKEFTLSGCTLIPTVPQTVSSDTQSTTTGISFTIVIIVIIIIIIIIIGLYFFLSKK